MRRWGLAQKLITAVCIISIVFSALFLFVQVNLFQNVYQEQQNESLEATAAAAQDHIRLYLQQMKNLCLSAAIREELKTGNAESIKEALHNFVDQTVGSVHFAFFVDADENIYCSNHVIFRVVQITMDYNMPLQIVRSMPGGNAVFISEPYRSSTSTLPAVAFAKRVYDNGHYVGSVVLEVDLATSCSTLQTATNLQTHSFLVRTEDGQKVFGIQHFPITDSTIEKMIHQHQKWQSYQDEYGQFRAFGSLNDGTEWNILLIADESRLYESLQDMIMQNVLISVCLLASLMLVIAILVSRFTVPLRQLADRMNGLTEKDLVFTEELKNDRQDEIGDMTRAFQSLLNRISQLMREQHEMERARTHAEIRALQNQLRPHFLYNTLNTISALVMDGKAHKVPSAISALIHLLVNCTDKTDPIVSLEDELQTTLYYLDIMKLRYGDRFDVAIQVPKQLRNCAVPKLVLQPLVENAVFHGLHSTSRHGVLEVEAGVNADGNLLLSVLDDGSGIPEEKMATLLTEEGDVHSTGLRNTHSRIRLYFGEKYGLRIESYPGIGTRVEAVLPLVDKTIWEEQSKEETK